MTKYRKLNQNFSGYELCPFCGKETRFTINPIIKVEFTCEHCGEDIYPCSLCDDCANFNDCKVNICETLLHYLSI